MAWGVWACACERQRRLEAENPTLAAPRPWEWEAARGCTADAPGAVAYWQREPLRRCPTALVKPWAMQYVRLYNHHRQGRALLPGGLLNWPARLLDALDVIEATVTDLERREREQAEAHTKQAQGPGIPIPPRAKNPVRPSTGKGRR